MMTQRWSFFGPLTGGVSWSVVQRWCAHQFKRWAWAILGAALGAGGVYWMASDVVLAHEQAQQAVEAAQAQLQVQVLPPLELVNPSAHAAWSLWTRLTGRRHHDIWTDLQQALSAQGVQVVSIRVLPDTSADPLSSQSVALRLNASYPDWVNAWRWVSASGPVLSIERMSVVPLAQSRGVQMDVVLRLWFKSGSHKEQAGPAWSVDMAAAARGAVVGASGADVFTHPGNVRAMSLSTISATTLPDAALRSADPLRWPLAQIRLLGTWQQGTQWQAVISAGDHWVPVQVGQRVSLEGHQVVSIHRDAVSLRSAQGQKLELNWPGGER